MNADVIHFHVSPSLPYKTRLLTGFGLILAGLLVQIWIVNAFPGILFVAAGSILFLVKGFDHRIKFGKFLPDATWEKVDTEKMIGLAGRNKAIQKWDRSSLDITSGIGVLTFIVMLGAIVALAISAGNTGRSAYAIVACNIAVAVLPHWIFGVRRAMTLPDPARKTEIFSELFDLHSQRLKNYNVESYMLLQGEKTKLPQDAKIRILPQTSVPGFLGLYCQVVLNTVQGSVYPYFYVVLVAKQGFGLPGSANFEPKGDSIIEKKIENGHEILVLRQRTTATSGYWTMPDTINEIFADGLQLLDMATSAEMEVKNATDGNSTERAAS